MSRSHGLGGVTHAIRVHAYGGPEQLRYETIPDPEPGPGQVRVRVEATGVNFIDVYQLHVVPAERVVPLPPGLDARQGAAAMLQGMTAHYLATSTFPLAVGHIALVHAAAGGTGLLLTQIARRRRARVIGTGFNARDPILHGDVCKIRLP